MDASVPFTPPPPPHPHPASPPRSPMMQDNPIYFGVFADPETAAQVSADKALEDLDGLAKRVREVTGMQVCMGSTGVVIEDVF